MNDRSAPIPYEASPSTASRGRAGGADDTSCYPTEEQERIAHDLGDTIVHQLFAASLDLAAALARIDDHRAADNVRHAINGLDQAITNLRRTVFESSVYQQERAACSPPRV